MNTKYWVAGAVALALCGSVIAQGGPQRRQRPERPERPERVEGAERPQRRVKRAASDWEYIYRCRACEAIYNTNTEALNRLIRQGRTAEPEDDYRLFECEVCGEIEAELHHETPREI